MNKPRCLIIGGGKGDRLPGGDFKFVTLDLNPDRQPDIIADATKLPCRDRSYEAVFASHILEHLSPRLYGNVIEEWYRILKPGGEILVYVPNITLAAEQILMGRTEDVVYVSPAGPIYPIDMLVGLKGRGVSDLMGHSWGFTRDTLALRAQHLSWNTGLVWEYREATPYDRCEVRLYGRKFGEPKWKGWELDLDLDHSGDPYAIKLGGK